MFIPGRKKPSTGPLCHAGTVGWLRSLALAPPLGWIRSRMCRHFGFLNRHVAQSQKLQPQKGCCNNQTTTLKMICNPPHIHKVDENCHVHKIDKNAAIRKIACGSHYDTNATGQTRDKPVRASPSTSSRFPGYSGYHFPASAACVIPRTWRCVPVQSLQCKSILTHFCMHECISACVRSWVRIRSLPRLLAHSFVRSFAHACVRV